MADKATTAAAETLRDIAGVHRARNGRLDIDWISRSQKSKWRMVPLDGQWYNRAGLVALVSKRPKPERVPASRRELTNAELRDLTDPNPWRLLRQVATRQ